jgi:hypothetical protein
MLRWCASNAERTDIGQLIVGRRTTKAAKAAKVKAAKVKAERRELRQALWIKKEAASPKRNYRLSTCADLAAPTTTRIRRG